MKLQQLFFFIIISLLFSCSGDQKIHVAQKDTALINYVNPFIGTGGHGHTYPGATMPFGMMQLSPDTRLDGWDGCSGWYHLWPRAARRERGESRRAGAGCEGEAVLNGEVQ